MPALGTSAVTLTPRGTAMVRNDYIEELDRTDGNRRPARLPGEFFLRHMVAVNDFRVALEVACRLRPDVELLGFVADTTRTSAGPGVQPQAVLSETVMLGGAQGERLLHVPDAAFALRRGDRQALFLAEVDRGTEVVGDPKRGVGLFVRFYLEALLAAPSRASAPASAGAVASKASACWSSRYRKHALPRSATAGERCRHSLSTRSGSSGSQPMMP